MRFRHQGNSLRIDAPAKLNLFLEVTGKRTDGYHAIETVMASVGIYDTLLFTPTESIARVTCAFTDQFVREQMRETLEHPEQNLVSKAVQLFASRVPAANLFDIHILKRIPSQAGLGGGSADAAATLAGLNLLNDSPLDSSALLELAGRLGSDIGFFLLNERFAVGVGRGEQVSGIHSPLDLAIVIVHPGFGLSTAEIYRHCQIPVTPVPMSDITDGLESGNHQRLLRALHNRLQISATRVRAEVRALCQELERTSMGPAMMTGSGSACFTICRSHQHARHVQQTLKQRGFTRCYAVGTAL